MPSIFLVIIRTSVREMRHWSLMFDFHTHLTVIHVQDPHWGCLLATGIVPHYLWTTWPRYETAIPIGDFQEHDYQQIIMIIRRVRYMGNCQTWVMEAMARLEAAGFINWEIAAWAAMEALGQV